VTKPPQSVYLRRVLVKPVAAPSVHCRGAPFALAKPACRGHVAAKRSEKSVGMAEVFRREAVEHATRRLAGDVILNSPLQMRFLS
jgi:hypothetical protein